ncbi:hypothetical protein CBL_21210, partial [Carabus blaptoides fortunei]
DNYHPALLVSYVKPPKIKPTPTLSKQYDYDYKNANFAKLYKELSECDWSVLNNVSDANVAVDIFFSLIYKCIDKLSAKTQIFVKMQSSPILNISGHLQIENRTQSDIPSSMNFNDAGIEGSDNIVNAFAEYFESV